MGSATWLVTVAILGCVHAGGRHDVIDLALHKLQNAWWRPHPAPWKASLARRLDAEDYRNSAPLIGVVTEPCGGSECNYGKSIVAGPIVEWIHSAGGRAVPVRFNDSPEWLDKLFKSVNGLVFPGGAVRLWWDSAYFVAAAKLFDMAKESNDKGDPFPVMGICLGFELLHILVANQTREELLVKTDAEGMQAHLKFESKVHQSLLYRGFPASLMHQLESPSAALAFMAHVRGVSPRTYRENAEISDFFDVLSTSLDKDGKEYVSSVEAKAYPFFGTQYHPEKPPHEFSDSGISHGRGTAELGFYAASALVDVARLNSHKISLEEEVDITIYNTRPSYVARTDLYKGVGPLPDILYFIDPPNH